MPILAQTRLRVQHVATFSSHLAWYLFVSSYGRRRELHAADASTLLRRHAYLPCQVPSATLSRVCWSHADRLMNPSADCKLSLTIQVCGWVSGCSTRKRRVRLVLQRPREGGSCRRYCFCVVLRSVPEKRPAVFVAGQS